MSTNSDFDDMPDVEGTSRALGNEIRRIADQRDQAVDQYLGELVTRVAEQSRREGYRAGVNDAEVPFDETDVEQAISGMDVDVSVDLTQEDYEAIGREIYAQGRNEPRCSRRGVLAALGIFGASTLGVAGYLWADPETGNMTEEDDNDSANGNGDDPVDPGNGGDGDDPVDPGNGGDGDDPYDDPNYEEIEASDWQLMRLIRSTEDQDLARFWRTQVNDAGYEGNQSNLIEWNGGNPMLKTDYEETEDGEEDFYAQTDLSLEQYESIDRVWGNLTDGSN
jgi:hypothetical protein